VNVLLGRQKNEHVAGATGCEFIDRRHHALQPVGLVALFIDGQRAIEDFDRPGASGDFDDRHLADHGAKMLGETAGVDRG